MTTFLQFKELVDLCPSLEITVPKSYRFEDNKWTMILGSRLTDSDVRYVSIVDFFYYFKSLASAKNISYHDWLQQKFGFVFHQKEQYYHYSLCTFLNRAQYSVLRGLVERWGVNGIDNCDRP